MCGIAGIVHRDGGHRVDEHALAAMCQVMVHRGPDDAGTYIGAGVGLGSQRLAILDLSERGHMPMTTDDGRYCIIHNGEVYNFRELRSKLKDKGFRFRSDTDTEVLLYLYAAQGPAMLDQLSGMFAFAIWDSLERTLFLARDRLGVKPLFYHLSPDASLHFASEQKAILSAGIDADFDHATWEELLCFRFVAGDRTPLLGIRRLLPGHYMVWKDGHVTIRRWWNLQERATAVREKLPSDPVTWFSDTFDSSVQYRRISDVPVGILLSSGLDSTSVAASLGRMSSEGLRSFTVRFVEPGFDEGPLARAVAEHVGLEHHELTLSPDGLLQRLASASWLSDEPLAHASDIYLNAIAEFAKPKVTVLLSGEGADEILGGYVRYRPLLHPALLHTARLILPRLARLISFDGRMGKLARALTHGPADNFIMYNACNVFPADLISLGFEPRLRFEYRENVLREARSLYPLEPFRQAMYSDQHTFLTSLLHRNDRMTMGASIECREPFLDTELVEGLAALSTASLRTGSGNKGLLKASIGRRLPGSVVRGRKWGFGVPWSRYFRSHRDLQEVIRGLADHPFLRSGPMEKKNVQRIVDSFLRGEKQWDGLVSQLAMMTIWHDSYLYRFARTRVP